MSEGEREEKGVEGSEVGETQGREGGGEVVD